MIPLWLVLRLVDPPYPTAPRPPNNRRAASVRCSEEGVRKSMAATATATMRATKKVQSSHPWLPPSLPRRGGVSPLSQEGLSHPTISPYETCMQMQYTGSLGSTGRSSCAPHKHEVLTREKHAKAHGHGHGHARAHRWPHAAGAPDEQWRSPASSHSNRERLT